MPGRQTSPILVGRAAESAKIDAVIDAALAGRPTHVLVGGEAGIGKSRLIREAVIAAEKKGFLVGLGACATFGGRGRPFGPFPDALRPLVQGLEPGILDELVVGPALSRILPELIGASAPIQPGEPDAAAGRVLEAIVAFLTALAARTPVLLVIEDIHWADPASLDTIGYIVRRAASERLLAIMTYRSDELHRRHPLLPWLAELERAGPMERITLRRLDLEGTARLIAAIGDDEMEPEMVARIHARADGNPFFIEELVQADRASGPGLPETLRDVLFAKIAALPEETQQLLGVAAAAGQWVDERLLTAVAQRSDVELHAGLRSAVAHGVLVVERRGEQEGYAFRHALIQEAAYEDLLPGERRALHRRFAGAIASIPGRDRDEVGRWAELAYHWSAAGDVEEAFAASLHAAEAASGAFAHANAQFQYEQALELWAEVAEPEAVAGFDRSDAFERAGQAALFAGEFRRALALRSEALAAMPQDASAERIAVAEARLGRALWNIGDPAAAVSRYEAAVDRLIDAEPTRAQAEVLAGSAQMDMLRGQWVLAKERASHAIEVARAVGDTMMVGHALNTLGSALSGLGDCGPAIDALRTALEIGREQRSTEDVGRGYVNLIDGLRLCGFYREAAEIVDEGLVAARSLGVERAYGGVIRFGGVPPNLWIGRWDRARELAVAALADPQSGRNWEVYSLAYTAELDVATGAEKAERSVTRLAELVLGYPRETHYDGPLHRALAEHRIWQGRYEDALVAVERGLDRMTTIDTHIFRQSIRRLGVWAAADLAAYARARRDKTMLNAILAQGDSLEAAQRDGISRIPTGHAALVPNAFVLTSAAEHARMHGKTDPAVWSEVAEVWDGLEAPYQAAIARWRLGEVLLNQRDRPAAAVALGASLATAAELGARPLREAIESLAARARLALDAPDPLVDTAEAQPRERSEVEKGTDMGLTPREVEVLALVGQGLTNRQIANELFISENTAGVHVSNILGKLGAATRTEAAAIAVHLGFGRRSPQDER